MAPRQSKIFAALRSQDVPKPQLLFQHVPTNAETEPFKPLLESKPHAAVPFDESLKTRETEDGLQQYPHPYENEIAQYEYPSRVYTHADPIPYLPYESTTATFVDTEEAVEEMLEELKQAKEIAIDLEHHDMRSYIGVVSLMQISTRNKDWIVDTLKPWRRKLQCLNEVFADPNIVKVLHGAFMDIMWLQRDLGLYVVGLFDTHYAARALGYTGGSLAFLLKKFVDFDAQKQYQMADWRIRPLPQEMFEYARSDTHFLLYIFDNMRNELIAKSDFSVPNHEKDKIHDVLVRSKDTSLQTYQHPIYDPEHGLGAGGWYKLLSRTPALLSKEQFAVFKAVHQWRDQVAREQDDSTHYILANHNIFSIAKEMPTEKPALFSVAQPLTQTVRLRSDELLAVISKAKQEGANGPDMHAVLNEVNIKLHGPLAYEMPAPKTNAQPAVPSGPTIATGPALNRITSQAAAGIRSTISRFWGSAFSNSGGQKRPLSSATLSVPLPPLSAEVFAETTESAAPPTPAAPTPKSTVSTPATAGQEDDSIFTLKLLGRKRKSDAITSDGDALATNNDVVGLPDEEEERRARKAEKKAAKRAKKEAEADAAAALEEEEAFDYKTAASVLNANKPDGSRGRRDDKKGKKGRETKAFNPFVKAMDAPKGLPRAQKEKAGKSMTFRD